MAQPAGGRYGGGHRRLHHGGSTPRAPLPPASRARARTVARAPWRPGATLPGSAPATPICAGWSSPTARGSAAWA
eukprot:6769243-Alexandrium_andersonii.AAC.1